MELTSENHFPKFLEEMAVHIVETHNVDPESFIIDEAVALISFEAGVSPSVARFVEGAFSWL